MVNFIWKMVNGNSFNHVAPKTSHASWNLFIKYMYLHSRSTWNLEMLIFEERGKKSTVAAEKPLGARREPTTNHHG